MSNKLIMIFALIFLILGLLGNVLESTYVTADQLTLFQVLEGQDIDGDGIGDGIRWWNIDFYSDLWNLFLKTLTWDYSFLQNEYQIFRLVGMAISLGFLIPFMMYIASLLSNLFTKLIGLGR